MYGFKVFIALGTLLASTLPAIADTLTLRCEFSHYHSGDGDKLKPASDFTLVFKTDTLTGESFLEGNNGLAGVEAVFGETGVSFVERLPTGAVQTTTYSPGGGAVHSRHTIIAGDLVPTQYYGDCYAD